MTLRSTIGAVALLAGAGLMAACSSDDSSGADDSVQITHSPTPTAGSAPVVVDETVASTAPPTTAEDNQAIGPPSPDELNLPPIPRACMMSTNIEAGEAIGRVGANSGAIDRSGMLGCSFTDAADDRVASIRIVTAEAEPAPDAVFAELAAVPDAEHVRGFGDDAIWADGALNVSINGEVVTLSLFADPPMDDDALRTATLAWAELVMPRYQPPEAG